MIQSIGHDHANSIMEIEFRSGKVYHYLDVPRSVYVELISASSKGRYFETHIKDAGYVHRRVH
jgi:hypothetical protein